jgi:nucleoside-diphosphate-sugar epimerase
MIVVTGANGFVGQVLSARLAHDNLPARLIVRHSPLNLNHNLIVNEHTYPNPNSNSNPNPNPNPNSNSTHQFAVGHISADTDWSKALKDAQSVVHLASRAHVLNEQSANPAALYQQINVDSTVNLAKQAAASGVKRFIFVSTIKVNGESTQLGNPFSINDMPDPQDAYSLSKYQAECELKLIGQQTGMEIVIIWPPIVYGLGVKANFLNMMKWLSKGIPLPLGGLTHNRRSLVAVDNLVDLIITCLSHPAAANQTFLVSDGEDLSTSVLLTRMGEALNKPARLYKVPQGLLKVGAGLANRQAIYERLCHSLQIDMGHTQATLNWKPPVSVEHGMRLAARQFQT